MDSSKHPRGEDAQNEPRPTKLLRQMDSDTIPSPSIPTTRLPAPQFHRLCFTDLPGEIRNTVYEYVLLLHKPNEWLKRPNTVVINIEYDMRPDWRHVPTARALLEVNKQVRRESMSFWYYNAIFRITLRNISSARSWLHSLKEDGLASLQRLELSYRGLKARYVCCLFLHYEYPFRHAKCHQIAMRGPATTRLPEVDCAMQRQMEDVFHRMGPVRQLTARHICLLIGSYFLLAYQRHGNCFPQQGFQKLGVEFLEILRLVRNYD